MIPSAMATRLLASKATQVLLILVVIAAAMAGLLTHLLNPSHADIGIDFVGEQTDAPRLAVVDFHGRLRDLEPMRRVSPQFAPSYYWFEVVLKGEQPDPPPGAEVRITGFKYPREVNMSPPGSWRVARAREALVAVPGQPGVLQWQGFKFDEELYLTFVGTQEATVVNYRTAAGAVDVDLNAGRDSAHVRTAFPVPRTPVARYHALVPRDALPNLAVQLGKDSIRRLRRLYVGTLVPRVFYGSGATRAEIDNAGSWNPVLGAWTELLQWDSSLVGTTGTIVDMRPALALEPNAFFLFTISFVLFAAMLIGPFWIVIWVLRRWQTSENRPRPQPAPSPHAGGFDSKTFWILLAPLAFCWLFYLAAFYPGSLSMDSLDQWAQAHGKFPITDAHPALHTLFVKLLMSLWDSPAIVILVQIGLLSTIIAYACTLLLRLGVSRWAVLAVHLSALLSPKNALMATMLWKDTPYAVAVVALTLILLRGLLDSKLASRLKYWAGVGVVLALIPLARHNGILVFLGLLPLLPLVFWRQRRGAALACVTALFIFGSTKLVLFPILGVQASPNFYPLRAHSVHLGALMEADVPLADRELEFISDLNSMKEWRQPKFQEYAPPPSEFAEMHFPQFESLARSLIKRFPLYLLRRRLEISSYMFGISPAGNQAIRVGSPGIGSHPLLDSSQLGLKTTPLLPSVTQPLRDFVEWSQKRARRWLLWMPSFHLYLVILAAAVLTWRMRDLRFLVLYAPVALNTLSIVLGATAQHARYQYPLTLITGTLLALALLPKTESPRVPERAADGTPLRAA